jgi:predicted amidohydrolase YtcJ
MNRLIVRRVVLAAVPFALAVPPQPADLILTHGRVYTLRWHDPAGDGTPAADAPRDARGWHPDAEAIAMRDGRIVFVGSDRDAAAYRGPRTRLIDLGGKTVLPGLIDAHVHLPELGANLSRVDLVGVRDEEEAVERVVARARTTPKGEWIIGWGWDEGAWASHYPTMELLSRRVPDHPVFLRGLHTFASWGNRLAFDRARITAATPSPEGGQVVKDAAGNPSGILLNSATALLAAAVPPRTDERLAQDIRAALDAMVKAGYTSVHEAGLDAHELAVVQTLARKHLLPIRLYVMLSARDTALLRAWLPRGPDTSGANNLTVRAVKAFADGALGSRGARLLADYSDRPGHRGITGGAYGYDSSLVAAMMRRGFQVAIHAIGDAANRETIDLFESTMARSDVARRTRPRIEHAQVLALDDLPRLGRDGIIASMQPSHAVEDMAWAETRVGPERIRGAYAWRSLRKSGARLVLSSDLPATDYNIFYGLHSAVTRQDKQGQPAGGWRATEALTPEEAVRGFTSWAAYAEFAERRSGQLAPGMRADVTVLSIDPFTTTPAELMKGAVAMTVANGRVLYSR